MQNYGFKKIYTHEGNSSVPNTHVRIPAITPEKPHKLSKLSASDYAILRRILTAIDQRDETLATAATDTVSIPLITPGYLHHEYEENQSAESTRAFVIKRYSSFLERMKKINVLNPEAKHLTETDENVILTLSQAEIAEMRLEKGAYDAKHRPGQDHSR